MAEPFACETTSILQKTGLNSFALRNFLMSSLFLIRSYKPKHNGFVFVHGGGAMMAVVVAVVEAVEVVVDDDDDDAMLSS
jgi:hypothetical protein